MEGVNMWTFKDWVVKQFGFEELESEDEVELLFDAQKAKDIINIREEQKWQLSNTPKVQF